MKIGDLAQRTQISPRMLRYYEEQGLLSPTRGRNGYRSYVEDDVATAQLVSSLIRSGLPTRLISAILDSAGRPDPAVCGRELKELFQAELARLESRIACLTLSRDAVIAQLARIATAENEPAAQGGPGRHPAGPRRRSRLSG